MILSIDLPRSIAKFLEQVFIETLVVYPQSEHSATFRLKLKVGGKKFSQT